MSRRSSITAALLLATTLVLCACLFPASAFIQLDPLTHQFVNGDSGSVELYHGVNVVYKEPPFLPCYNCSFDPAYSLNAEDLSNLRDNWGFNMIRLGIMWTAVEPTPQNYNYTFLAEARALVDALGQEGFVVLVDMHQDLFSPATCGEGFPQWVAEAAITSRACNESFIAKAAHLVGACKSITEFGMRFDSQNNPLPEDCVKHPFSLFYPTPEVATSFQSLYDNHESIQDSFVAFWQVVAQTFASSEAVIGYDLINEPFVGDLWSDILDVVVPGMTDRKYLQPMYERLNQAIREGGSDSEHLVFYEPTPLPDALPLFGGIVSPIGFNSTPGALTSSGKDVLSYHIYCCLSAPDACDADGNPTDPATCDKFNPKVMTQRMKDANRLASGGFLTEFGACTTGAACVGEIERTTNAADDNLQSWAYWSFKYFDDITTTSGPKEGFYQPNSTEIYTDKVTALSRTYAQVIQGTPISMNFNSSTAFFQLTYSTNEQAKAPTTIFVNEQFYYPEGVNVQAGPTQYVSFSYKNNFVTIEHSANIPLNTTVTVNISPMF